MPLLTILIHFQTFTITHQEKMKKLIGYAFFAYFWSVAKAFEFVCLVGRSEKKTFVWGPGIVHSGPQKLLSSKWRENRGENVEAYYVTKIPSLFIALTYPSYFPTSCDLINPSASSSLSLSIFTQCYCPVCQVCPVAQFLV